MRLAPVVGAFFVGRVISYTFWSATADTIVDRVEDMFSSHWSSVTVLALEVLALLALVVVTRVDWPRLLPFRPRPGPRDRRRERPNFGRDNDMDVRERRAAVDRAGLLPPVAALPAALFFAISVTYLMVAETRAMPFDADGVRCHARPLTMDSL